MIGSLFLGRYEVLAALGKGSMGRAYLARRKHSDRLVVVKVMHDHVARQPKFREYFRREIRFMARLRHPFAVALVEASLDDPLGPCIVMDYIPGVTLDVLLRKQKRLAPDRFGKLLGQLCHALQAAHDLGIVHRDLKPPNLMIVDPDTPDESLRVMDFGLGLLALKPHIPMEKLVGEACEIAVGTPCYICPEQIRGDELDHRGDLYSVGVIMYEVLTGRVPFDGFEVEEILRQHVEAPPPPFSKAGLDGVIPPAVEAFVAQCLGKYPHERPQSARELARRYGEAVGKPIWPEVTAPAPPLPPAAVPHVMAAEAETAPKLTVSDPRAVLREFDAWMPEKIAIVKLRGFVEDMGGKITESVPGLIRVQIGETPAGPLPGPKGLLSWLMPKPPADDDDPIAIELHMYKPTGGAGPLNTIRISALFRPVSDRPLTRPALWKERCEKIFNDLRGYLIARH